MRAFPAFLDAYEALRGFEHRRAAERFDAALASIAGTPEERSFEAQLTTSLRTSAVLAAQDVDAAPRARGARRSGRRARAGARPTARRAAGGGPARAGDRSRAGAIRARLAAGAARARGVRAGGPRPRRGEPATPGRARHPSRRRRHRPHLPWCIVPASEVTRARALRQGVADDQTEPESWPGEIGAHVAYVRRIARPGLDLR